MFDRLDMAIVGSGVAGAAAAAVAARLGARVALLVRRGTVPGFGEVIDPQGLGVLDRMGLRGRVSGALGASVKRLHLRWPPEHEHARTLPGTGSIVSVTRLIIALRECAAAAGARVVETDGTVDGTGLRRCDDGWELCMPSMGPPVAVSWIVDATGQGEWAQAHGLQRESVYRHTVVHVVGHRAGAHGWEPASMLVCASADGWSYRLLSPGPQFAGAVFRRDGEVTPRQVRAIANALIGADGGIAHVAASARVVRCELAFARQCSGTGWIAIGGAALCLDPLSGQGIGWALESAWQGTQACFERADQATQLARYRSIWTVRVADAHRAAVRHHEDAAKAYGAPFWLETLQSLRGTALPPLVPMTPVP